MQAYREGKTLLKPLLCYKANLCIVYLVRVGTTYIEDIKHLRNNKEEINEYFKSDVNVLTWIVTVAQLKNLLKNQPANLNR